jgi:hypothetical protein
MGDKALINVRPAFCWLCWKIEEKQMGVPHGVLKNYAKGVVGKAVDLKERSWDTKWE